MKRPPASPSKRRSATDFEKEPPEKESAIEKNPMPNEPIGTSPSSTLSPDKRPARRLPAPIPTASEATRRPVLPSERFMTSFAKRSRSIWKRAPRNQNQDIQITVKKRTLS